MKINQINYEGRIFQSIANVETGDVSNETRFYYHHNENVVWATYAGGAVKMGALVAKILSDGELEMRYSHVNKNGDLMTGTCRSTPEILADGRVRLYEKWQWTCGDFARGESIVEEVLPHQ